MNIIYLLAFLLLEPVKRVASALFYPLAYVRRDSARDLRRCPAWWEGYLYFPAGDMTLFWLLLDDSIHMETGMEYLPNESKYLAWIWKRGDAWRAYWWSAIRNSCVNFNNFEALQLGRFISEDDHAGKRNFWVTRVYKNGRRPYCEFYLFGRWNQIGWLKGKSPKFEIDFMKKRG